MKTIFCAVLLLAVSSLVYVSGFAQSPSREDLRREIETKRAELLKLETQLLAPAKEDEAAYATFLDQPNTGLIRLLPRERYDTEVYREVKKTITLRGGGAYYSFSRRSHEYGAGSDIAWQAEYLSVGFAGADYGMMTAVEDVSLESLTPEHYAVQLLSKYVPPKSEPEARLEYRRFQEGTTISDWPFLSRLPARPGITYLLRSISYGQGDLLVGFRVIRKDTDNSLIILWKLIKKYPVPALAKNN